MKRYALFQAYKNGDDFSEFIDAKTEKEAIDYAEYKCAHLTKKE